MAQEHPKRPAPKSAFKPGVSGNPKGSSAKARSFKERAMSIRESLLAILEPRIKELAPLVDMDTNPNIQQHIKNLAMLYKLVIPKVTETDITTGGEPFKVIFPPSPDKEEELE